MTNQEESVITKQVETYTKLCSRCNSEKPLTEFTKLKPRRNRKDPTKFYAQTTGTHDCWCKACRREAAKLRARKNPGPILRIAEEDRHIMSDIRYRLNVIKSRCKKHGYECDLTDDFLLDKIKEQHLKCPYTGLPFEFTREKSERAPSLDRINPKKGYTQDNVEWVCWAINRAKGEMTKEDLIAMCYRVVETHK